MRPGERKVRAHKREEEEGAESSLRDYTPTAAQEEKAQLQEEGWMSVRERVGDVLSNLLKLFRRNFVCLLGRSMIHLPL